MTRYGTSDFQSKAAAVRYYSQYGYDDPAEAVENKLKEGEISIGRPSNLKDSAVFRWDEDGRGEIIETS